MARDIVDAEMIESRDDLVAWLAAGGKPAESFRIGVEHEKFPFYTADLKPVPYEGARGVKGLLEGAKARLGWAPIEDEGALIGLYDENGGGAISLEPGGQFELSGAPQPNVHAIAAELNAHLNCMHAVGEELGIGFFALGLSPKWTLAETPMMPKSRYRIMARYMPTVGARGLDMMFRTSTAQANLDFADEADMVVKLRVGLALQPTITALFANSPFAEGGLNGFLSARSEIWRHTDAARTGTLPFVFAPGMGFERYVDYVLDVPLYFVKRGAVYHDVAGASFRDLLEGKLAALPGERATVSDWANHLSTIFPEVRLKRYLEMRGADVGSRERILALAAFCFGLFYDKDALAAASALSRGWTAGDLLRLRDDVPRLGLKARIGGRPLLDVAREAVALASGGLARRARRDGAGRDETLYLAPLERIAAEGRTPAEVWIERFNGPWAGSVDPVFREAAI